MRKSISLLATMALMLCSCLQVSAAPTNFPLSYGNSYTYTETGGGDYEYTVPLTGNYEITLAGSSGSAYGSTSGGAGCTLNRTVRLQYGDTVKFSLNDQPSVDTKGDTLYVHGGLKSTLYMNGVKIWEASGGAAQVPNRTAPDGVMQVVAYSGDDSASVTLPVHWHSGGGKSGATHANSFPQLNTYTNPGGCYVGRHVCDSQCRRVCGSQTFWTGPGHDYRDGCSWHHYHPHSARQWSCYACGDPDEDFVVGSIEYEHDDECPKEPPNCTRIIDDCTGKLNVWSLGCGMQQGQILGTCSTAIGPCFDSVWGDSSAEVSNIGSGRFSIRLAEHDGLYYTNTKVSLPAYKSDRCNLIVRDNTVVFYKRQ